jgi:hypothetical protein
MIVRGAVPPIHVFRRGIARRDARQAVQPCYWGSTPAFLTRVAYFASSERK